MKRCSTCGHDKPLTDYNRDSRSKDGRKARCKVCKKAIEAEERTLLAKRLYMRAWRERNREHYRAYCRQYNVRRKQLSLLAE